jgi:hypothetical protein
MFDITQKELDLQGKKEPITSFQVWFQTPFGLYEELEEAIKKCEDTDLHPLTCVVPVPVAVSETLYEVLR